MALIKLKRPATLNKFVNLACLSEKGEDEQVDFLDFISCIFLALFNWSMNTFVHQTLVLVSRDNG